MRYIIWIMAMFGDVLLITCASYLVWLSSGSVFAVTICAIAFWAWNKNGAFDAWRPSVIKQYMANAKKIGL